MSEYTDRVERNLEGLEAVSTGVCPGCEECARNLGYEVAECDSEYCSDDCHVEVGPFPNSHSNLNPQTHHPSEAHAQAAMMERFAEDWSSGKVFSEGSFSQAGCGICGSSLGGTLYPWHALDSDGELLHFDDACVDCVVYLANGDEPEAS